MQTERKRFTLVKTINHGEIIPAWYGVAWVNFNSEQAVCLPMPFNRIAAMLRGLLIWLKHAHRPVPFSSRDAYHQGFKAGQKLVEHRFYKNEKLVERRSYRNEQ